MTLFEQREVQLWNLGNEVRTEVDRLMESNDVRLGWGPVYGNFNPLGLKLRPDDRLFKAWLSAAETVRWWVGKTRPDVVVVPGGSARQLVAASLGVLGTLAEIAGVPVINTTADQDELLYRKAMKNRDWSGEPNYGQQLIEKMAAQLGWSRQITNLLVLDDVVGTATKAVNVSLVLSCVEGLNYGYGLLSAPVKNELVAVVGSLDEELFLFLVNLVNAHSFFTRDKFAVKRDKEVSLETQNMLQIAMARNYEYLLNLRMKKQFGDGRPMTLADVHNFTLVALAGREEHQAADVKTAMAFREATGLELATLNYFFRRVLEEVPHDRALLPRLPLIEVPLQYRVLVAELLTRFEARGDLLGYLAEKARVGEALRVVHQQIEAGGEVDWGTFQNWADLIAGRVTDNWLKTAITGYVRG